MTILITGSSRGIGAAIQAALTEAGATVIGHGTASGIPADFSDPAGPTALWNAALEQAGGAIDVLINNGGCSRRHRSPMTTGPRSGSGRCGST